jgi:hypothetical protein
LLVSPGTEPSSATPINSVPPSELAKATIADARDSALRTSALNWRVLSSPLAICSKGFLWKSLFHFLGFLTQLPDDETHLSGT